MPVLRPLRRKQLISPFGVGAMVDFPGDECLMTAGLDAWPFAYHGCPVEYMIREERLEVRLAVAHFRMPPEHREPGAGALNPNIDIPFVRFPRWHYCPYCGLMEERDAFSPKRQRCPGHSFNRGRSCIDTPQAKRKWLIPVRIVAVCGKGHLQDFPFMQWVHREKPVRENCKLRWQAGRASATLSGVRIECTCGLSETLGTAFFFDRQTGGALHRMGIDCRGDRPWLGEIANSDNSCGEFLRVLQRGASNVYFPKTVSSIYLPLWAEEVDREIIDALDDTLLWDMLTDGLIDGHEIDLSRCKQIAKHYGIDAMALHAAATRKLNGITIQTESAVTEESYRHQEYVALRDCRGDINSDLMVESADINLYGDEIAMVINRVCLVRKLRETRVLSGFTRLLPPDEDTTGHDQSDTLQSLSAGNMEWLPATVVRGEGVFVEFNETAINEWLRSGKPQARIDGMLQNYNNIRRQRGLNPRNVTPKFILIHTFAHMLINQLSYDCGYGSAALRERVFCESEDNEKPMQGVLIYTAAGDSEGTMGGLVRQGESARFRATLLKALQRAQWCSSDPICRESTGQGTDSANLAACHGCVLVSETSCEVGNKLLDRILVTGESGRSVFKGYFSDLLDIM